MAKELPDSDFVIASLLFQLWAENERYKATDDDGNPTILIAKGDVEGNRGYDVVMTPTEAGDVRITLKR